MRGLEFQKAGDAGGTFQRQRRQGRGREAQRGWWLGDQGAVWRPEAQGLWGQWREARQGGWVYWAGAGEPWMVRGPGGTWSEGQVLQSLEPETAVPLGRQSAPPVTPAPPWGFTERLAASAPCHGLRGSKWERASSGAGGAWSPWCPLLPLGGTVLGARAPSLNRTWLLRLCLFDLPFHAFPVGRGYFLPFGQVSSPPLPYFPLWRECGFSQGHRVSWAELEADPGAGPALRIAGPCPGHHSVYRVVFFRWLREVDKWVPPLKKSFAKYICFAILCSLTHR